MSQRGAGLRRVIGLVAVLSAAVILGCMDRSLTGPTLIGTADSLQVSSGNNQNGIVSTALSTPLTVQVRTATGAAVAGTSVTFSVATGGGSVSPQWSPLMRRGARRPRGRWARTPVNKRWLRPRVQK